MEAGRHRDNDQTARPPVDPVRLPDFSEILLTNPMMANPAAAMMAATAIGFGVANHMAAAFFGALQDAMDHANRLHGDWPSQPPGMQAKTTEAGAETAPSPKKAAARRKTASTEGGVAAKKPKTKAAAGGGRKKLGKDGSDLKRISGIGPKLEKVLNGLGVTSLAEVAAWTQADIDRFDGELSLDGRIARDDWVGQAQAQLR